MVSPSWNTGQWDGQGSKGDKVLEWLQGSATWGYLQRRVAGESQLLSSPLDLGEGFPVFVLKPGSPPLPLTLQRTLELPARPSSGGLWILVLTELPPSEITWGFIVTCHRRLTIPPPGGRTLPSLGSACLWPRNRSLFQAPPKPGGSSALSRCCFLCLGEG